MIRALLRTLGIVESDRAARGSAVGRMRAWVFGVVCLAAFAGQAYALFVREVGSPLEVSGTNVTVIEAFGTGAAISQTFVPVDGQEQWGDLRFRTRTVSRFRVFEAAAQDLPRPFREPSVMFVLLAIYNWAAMTFIYYMVVAGAEEW